jgi:hypothetical protein
MRGSSSPIISFKNAPSKAMAIPPFGRCFYKTICAAASVSVAYGTFKNPVEKANVLPQNAAKALCQTQYYGSKIIITHKI